MWCYVDMSHCEWAVCGCEGFLVLVSLLYVGLVRFVIRLKYIPFTCRESRWEIEIWLHSPLSSTLKGVTGHTPFDCSSGKRAFLPTEEEAWKPELFWTFGVEINLLSLPDIGPLFLGRPAHVLVTVPSVSPLY